MERTDYSVTQVRVDGEPVRTGGWSVVSLPEPAVTGALLVPHGVVNNPRFRVLAVDGDVWETEDTGLRTMEWGDPAEQSITDLAVACLAGRLHVSRSGDTLTITNKDHELTLGPASPHIEFL